MSHRILTSLLLLAAGAAARADQVLYQYECNVLPSDPSTGWIAGACQGPCSESIQGGVFLLHWTSSKIVAFIYDIAQAPEEPPAAPFWVEWRFRSDTPMPPTAPGCDGQFIINYLGVKEAVSLHGDAAVSFEGSDWIGGLELDTFHTFRFETLDGVHYTVAADGTVFIDDICGGTGCPDTSHYMEFAGLGACGRPTTDGWDYIRWGQMSTGESIVSTSPQRGFLDPDQYAGTDRFTITLHEPGYVHIGDIAVTASGGNPPVVRKTWRRDGFTPKQIEVVLDRPLALGETTTFTFAGLNSTANTVSYTLANPIPATSAWSVAACMIAIAIAGTVLVRRTAND